MENLERRGSSAARVRPTRAEVEPAALELIERYGAAVLGTARRYSLTPEDAEDAYQRGLEILLTKAPSTDHDELLPWLRTVVKHEAFAVRRHRERNGLPTEEDPDEAAGASSAPDEQAERYERLRLAAEALSRLKPQEIRCLLMRAEGYSYSQICRETGWTYTKVNRCITEGRRSFVAQVTGIEDGAECRRLSPLLSALADGEATHEDMRTLRPHLRSCLACRAALRHYRSVPAQVSAVAAPVAVAPGADVPGGFSRAFDFAVCWLQERSLLVGMKVQQAVEVASAGKVAAVAASTAALAGGGVATVTSLEQDGDGPQRAQRQERRQDQASRRPPPVARPLPERPQTARPSKDSPPPPDPAPAVAPSPVESAASGPARAPSSPSPPPSTRPSSAAGGSSPRTSSQGRESTAGSESDQEEVPPEAAYGL